ncbi:MAG: YcxB family protein [Bacteroidia bacterium]|nr:YcxB family protein [Bacteroidia bacterium]
MKISYIIEAKDFLAYQLYTASRSDAVIKKRRRTRWLVPILYLAVAGVISLTTQNGFFMLPFALVGALWFTFYPWYSRAQYKRHYQKHINSTYAARFGQMTSMTLEADFLHLHDEGSETKIKIREIKHLVEISTHFFLALQKGLSVIIPKDQLQSVDAVKKHVTELGIKIVDETQWKWK